METRTLLCACITVVGKRTVKLKFHWAGHAPTEKNGDDEEDQKRDSGMTCTYIIGAGLTLHQTKNYESPVCPSVGYKLLQKSFKPSSYHKTHYVTIKLN